MSRQSGRANLVVPHQGSAMTHGGCGARRQPGDVVREDGELERARDAAHSIMSPTNLTGGFARAERRRGSGPLWKSSYPSKSGIQSCHNVLGFLTECPRPGVMDHAALRGYDLKQDRLAFPAQIPTKPPARLRPYFPGKFRCLCTLSKKPPSTGAFRARGTASRPRTRGRGPRGGRGFNALRDLLDKGEAARGDRRRDPLFWAASGKGPPVAEERAVLLSFRSTT